jgi:predicted peptidase
MNLLVAAMVVRLLGQPPASGIHELTFRAPDGSTMLYAISIPKAYDAERPVPLVLVLHSGGERMRYYGSAFMRLLVEPALNGLRPIMIAPDCPTNSWTDPAAEQSVMALVQDTLDRYAIDRRRILVTGFSLGGRGTWFMASRHADLFTAAIPMAASTAEPIDRLGVIPTYIIHSRDDEVSPFAPAERTARQLTAMGRSVRFDALYNFGHYEMYRYVDSLRRAGRWVAGQWGTSRDP